MPGILSTNRRAQALLRSLPKNANGRVDRLSRHRRFGLVSTDSAALHHPKPFTGNRPRDTNPIARGRVSGFAQSGFNEVAHRAKPDHHRRATSQNPPDSAGVAVVIQTPEREEFGDGSF